MLNFISKRELKDAPELEELKAPLFALKHEVNPLSFLNKNSHIWVEREGYYDVYELTQSWDSQLDTRAEFVNALWNEAMMKK